MSQQCALVESDSASLRQLQTENAELQKFLAAQTAVVRSLERRVGRSLETMGVHLQSLSDGLQGPAYRTHLDSVQNEVDRLCDLIADTLVLQKLEAGKVEVQLERLDLCLLLEAVSRHLLGPKNGLVRVSCEVSPFLPYALADSELTEAVLTDLLARGLKYSDANVPVLLSAESIGDRIHVCVTAQRFAPEGNRDFATEIVLCCRRIEVQNGEVTCHPHPNGLQTVTIALQASP